MKNYLLATLLLGSFPARACDCLGQSTAQNYHRADFVLRVHIEAIQDTVQYDLYSNPVRPPFAAGAGVRARVRRAYKGGWRAKELIIKATGSMCDCRFARGGDYVVFLYKSDADPAGVYSTSTCQRHFNLRDAATRREFAHVRQAEK